jgi:AraC family transcriptional regulator
MDERATLTLLGYDGQGGPERLTAALIATTAGVIDAPAVADTQISLHLGPPIWASCGYASHAHRRLQSEGDLDLLPAGLAGVWHDEAPGRFLLMRLPEAVLNEASGGPARLEPRFQFRDPRVQHIGFALKAELEDGGPNGRIYVDALGLALAAHLAGRYASGLAPAPTPAGAQALSPGQTRRVREHVEAHLDRDLAMADLASVAGVGVSHFRALFGRTFGMPPHRYLVERRVARAQALIAADAAPLAEIALMAGFSHQSHLARWMRRLTGATPATLKRRA